MRRRRSRSLSESRGNSGHTAWPRDLFRRHRSRCTGGVPAALLGRLAVSEPYKGQGLGKALLYDAMQKIINNPLAVAAFIVDTKDEHAAAFYRKQGFLCFGPGRSKFYLPLKDVKRLFNTNQRPLRTNDRCTPHHRHDAEQPRRDPAR